MKFKRLCLMLPTYGRAKTLLPAFIHSAYNHADSAICFCFCVSSKDRDTLHYLTKTKWPEDFEYDVIIEDTIQPDLAAYFNLMYDRCRFNDDQTLVSMLGDDMEFKTQNYDRIILDRVNRTGGMGVYYCDDDYIAHGNLCINLFVTRPLVRATRLPFMCPFFKADMIDVVWHQVGEMTGLLQYIPDVVIKHNHNTARKSVNDYDVTFRRLQPLQRSANEPALQRSGQAFATVAAANLISAGIGAWQ